MTTLNSWIWFFFRLSNRSRFLLCIIRLRSIWNLRWFIHHLFWLLYRFLNHWFLLRISIRNLLFMFTTLLWSANLLRFRGNLFISIIYKRSLWSNLISSTLRSIFGNWFYFINGLLFFKTFIDLLIIVHFRLVITLINFIKSLFR